MSGYKCWVYVLRVVSNDSFYVGFTSDLETRLDAHRKGRGHDATRIGPLELVEVVECDSETAREIEKTKTIECIEKYGTDRVVGHRFSIKKKPTKKRSAEERQPVREIQSIISYAEDDEYFRVCEECIHFDNPDHHCTLLDETTLGSCTCIFWSSGLWGESLEEIEENATKQAQKWLTAECADIVRELFGRGCVMEQIRNKAFPNLDQQKPYTAYVTQKGQANDFILRSLGIPKGKDEWDAYNRLREEVRGRIGDNQCNQG